MRRKILSVLLVLCMVLTLLPASALAVEVDEVETGTTETEGTDTTATTVAKIGNEEYSTLKAAFDAVTDSNAATITLTAGATITECITIATGKDITLDIGSYNISVPSNADNLWKDGEVVAMFSVSGKLTIKGTGAITAKENDTYVVNVVGGTCALEGNVTYTGNISVVQVQSGTLTVAGGTFKLAQKAQTYNDSRYMLNCIDAAYQSKTATIEVTGGTFEDFDPGKNKAEGEETSFLKAGYESTANDDGTLYTVTKKALAETDVVAKIGSQAYDSLSAAVSAASSGDTIVLQKNVDISEPVNITKQVTLDLSGKTVGVDSKATIWSGTNYAMFQVLGENAKLTIKGSGAITAKSEDSYVACVNGTGAECIFEGKATYTGNITVAHVWTGTITVKDGTFKLDQKDDTKPYAFMLNIQDANAQDGSGKIVVTGGVFYGVDPADTQSDPNDPTSYVAEGCVSTKTSEATGDTPAVWTVKAEQPLSLTIGNLETFPTESWWSGITKDKLVDGDLDFATEGQTVTVTGTLRYAEWPAFNSEESGEQAGHYLPLQIKLSDTTRYSGQKVTIKGATEKVLDFGSGGSFELAMFLDKLDGKNDTTEGEFTITLGEGENAKVYTVDCTGLTLLPKLADDTNVEIKTEGGKKSLALTVKEDNKVTAGAELPETLGSSDNAKDIGSLEIEVKPSTVGKDDIKDEVSGDIKAAINAENTKIVEVTVKVIGATASDANLFNTKNALNNTPITVTIGGLTSGKEYYVFCIMDDGTVTSYGYVKTNSESISFTTTHLCKFGASLVEALSEEQQTALKAAVAADSDNHEAGTTVTGGKLTSPDGSASVDPADKVTATYTYIGKRTDDNATEYDKWGSGKLELKGLESNGTYMLQIESSDGRVYQVIKPSSGEMTMSVQGRNDLELTMFKVSNENTMFKDLTTGNGQIFAHEPLESAKTIIEK